ncbi:hypothetical protein ES703_120106 [subsurface metagenome]
MEITEQVSSKDLRGADIFAGLSDDNLEQIAKSCKQHLYEAGEYCAVQGEMTDHLFIANGGKVAIEMRIHVAPHTHTVTIATLTKGSLCAWSALVPPHTLTASVKCVERTPILSIAASDMQRIFEKEPSIERTVMKNLAGMISSRLRDTHTQMVRLIVEVIKEGR